MNIGHKIIIMLGALITFLLIGVVFVLTSDGKKYLVLSHEETVKQFSHGIIHSLTAIMETGSATIAKTFTRHLKMVEGFEDIRILRLDGKEAFQDNNTITQVNTRRGKLDFLPRKKEAQTVILAQDDIHLAKTLQTGKSIYYSESFGMGGRFRTNLEPILNHGKCHRCHWADQPILGILKITTDVTPVEKYVNNFQVKSIELLGAAIIVALIFTYMLINRVAIRPIRILTDVIEHVSSQTDLSKEVPIHSNDELGFMTYHFNRMLVRLHKSYDDLNKEIKRRTLAEQQLADHAANLEEMVNQRTKQLVHADRLSTLGTFSAGMAHEINNPNSFILSGTQFLEQYWNIIMPILEKHGNEDESGRVLNFASQAADTIQDIQKGSARITNIVDSLKTYSKREAYGEKTACRLLDPILDAKTLLQHQLKHGVTLDISVSPDISVDANRQQLSQVFINLLSNAIDAMHDNSSTKEIFVSSAKVDDDILVRIRDNGPGIPADIAENIFDPFFTTKGKTRGTGLGLSIVQGILSNHNAEICVVQTKAGAGAELVISFKQTG